MRRPPRVWLLSCVVELGLGLGVGCGRGPASTGDTAGHDGGIGGASGGANGIGGGGGSAVTPKVDAAVTEAGSPDAGGEPMGPGFDPGFDPGFVGMRRLSDVEYARTMQDLLGLSGLDTYLAASVAVDAVDTNDFDNAAGAASISEARVEAYFRNAVALADEVFASPQLRARIVTCAPTSTTDDACARAIVRAFGLRAWRRPLTDAEVADLVALVRADLDGGDTFPNAVEQAVLALVTSETFLYRLEADPPPPSTATHALGSFELASRLSYLVWSSMPDDALLSLAATDELQKPAVLAQQVSRMLGDGRADGFVRNFFGQWLGFRALETTPVVRQNFGWSPAIQASMAAEAHLFVEDVVESGGSLAGLLTTDVNFLDANLALLYAVPTPLVPTPPFARTVIANDQRKGYLGLGAWLLQYATPNGDSSVGRGVFIDEKLLCLDVPGPGGALVPPPGPGTPAQHRAARLSMPGCGSCHALFETVGEGLDNFDEIGRFRTSFPGDTAIIDASGQIPDGATFDGPLALADALAGDPRFLACARREALVYALGRPLTDADAARVAAIDARSSAAGDNVGALLSAIVVDDLFRYRRGEGAP